MPKFFKFCLITLLMLMGFITLTIWVLSSYSNRTRSTTRPIWSPDGRSLLFGGQSGNGTDRLYQVNGDGTGLRPLAEAPRGGSFFDEPSWSPDSKSVAILSRFDSGNDEIWQVDRSAFSILQIVKSDGSDRYPPIHQVGTYRWVEQRLVLSSDFGVVPRRLYTTPDYKSGTQDFMLQPLEQLESFEQKGIFIHPIGRLTVGKWRWVRQRG
jgi:Tol biopolymer transport system component